MSERNQERVATDQFRQRIESLTTELGSINRQLSNVNLLSLARRASMLLRKTKALMDGNVTVLFGEMPDSVPQDLYRHIEYAEIHIQKALSDEYEFEVIKQRLFMATSICELVIDGVREALTQLEGRSGGPASYET